MNARAGMNAHVRKSSHARTNDIPPRRTRIPAFPALLLLLVLLAAAPLYADLRVHFIDVGQAGAILLETDDAAVLVDAGEDGRAAEYIARREIENINLIVASHAHADHIGGVPDVYDVAEVGKIWYNGQEHTTLTFERFLDTVLDSDSEYLEPGRGHSRSFGDLTLTVLHPEGSAADYDGHLHDKNIVVRADYREFSVVLPGDAEASVERALVEAEADLNATVLNLGHHGSNTSSASAFLEAINPQTAVYQAGADNPYGHPHDDVLARVEAAGDIEVYGTDTHGTVVIESDGYGFETLTEVDGDIALADVCVDLNEAPAEELERIMHIGESRAEAIVRFRPFESIDELTRIPGIAEGRLADIREQGIVCEP